MHIFLYHMKREFYCKKRLSSLYVTTSFFAALSRLVHLQYKIISQFLTIFFQKIKLKPKTEENGHFLHWKQGALLFTSGGYF